MNGLKRNEFEVAEEIKNIDTCCIFKRVVPVEKKIFPRARVYCKSLKCRKNSAIPKYYIHWSGGSFLSSPATIKNKDIKIACFCPGCKKLFPISLDAYETQTKEKIDL